MKGLCINYCTNLLFCAKTGVLWLSNVKQMNLCTEIKNK